MQSDDLGKRSVQSHGFESLSSKETKGLSGVYGDIDTSGTKRTDLVLTTRHRQHSANCVTICYIIP